MDRETGDSLAIGSTTLHKRLHEQGLLRSTDARRGTLTVRHMLAGARRNVLHLDAGSLMPQETAQPDQDDKYSTPGGQKAWSGSRSVPDQSATETDQQTRPDTGSMPGKSESTESDGQIGQVLRGIRDQHPDSEGGTREVFDL